jgi:hypothetical protein
VTKHFGTLNAQEVKDLTDYIIKSMESYKKTENRIIM